MKRREQWAWAWLLLASAFAGCSEAPKPAEPEPPAPVRITPPPHYTTSCIALSPDGKTLAYGLAPIPVVAVDPVVAAEAPKPGPGRVVLCEARTGKELRQLPGPDGAWPCDARFSPDGKCIAVASSSKGVTLWNVATGKNQGDLEGTVGDCSARLWTPDGAQLLGAVWLNIGRPVYYVWSAEDRQIVRCLDVKGPWGGAGPFAIAADSRPLAVEHSLIEQVHPDRKDDHLNRWRSAVDLWDVSSGRRLGVIAGFSAPVEAYHPPPSRLLEVGADAGQFKARALPGGRYLLLPTYPDGRAAAASNQVLSVTGGTRRLESQVPPTPVDREAGTLIVREAATGKELRRLTDFADGSVYSTLLSPDGDILVVQGNQEDRSPAFLMVYDVSDLNRAIREARARLTPEQLAPLWDALADRDATKAFPAMRLLALNPDRAVPILKERLRPADDRPVPKFLLDLNADDFETREVASHGLAALGESARAALEKALAAGPGPEARRRIEELLEKLTDGFGPEDLRGVRSVDVLEQIGTDAARDVLKGLATGAPGALTTQAAKDALARLEKAPTP